MQNIQQLAAAAPTVFNEATPDWAGVSEALPAAGVSPGDVVAATWCQLGHRNIEALIDATQLVLIHRRGLLATLGKKKMFGGAVKLDAVDFAKVRAVGPADYTDDRGFGKFCLELAGPGGMLLGRLQWAWRGKRFRNNQDDIMSVAEERDRIQAVIDGLLPS